MKQIPNWILISISILLVGVIAWYFSNIITYVLVAGVLSIIGNPITNFLSKLKIKGRALPRGITSLFTMLLMLAVFIGLISVFIPLLTSQAKILSRVDYIQVAQSIDEPMMKLEKLLGNWNLQDETNISLSEAIAAQLMQFVNFTNLSSLVNSIISATGNIIFAVLSISFILFFFLKDEGLFYRIIKAITPGKYSRNIDHILVSITQLLTRYFVGILIQITIITIWVGLGLHFVGLQNAMLIGFLAGMFNIIPYVGPFLGALVGISLGITSHLDAGITAELWPLILKIILVFMTMQALDNFILQPFLLGGRVKAHPLEIFIVILAAGSIAGIGGMILAIPAYTVFRIIAKEFFSEFRLVQSLTKDI